MRTHPLNLASMLSDTHAHMLYLYTCDANENIKTQENILKSCRMTCFCAFISTQTPRLMLPGVFNLFDDDREAVLIGGLMVVKGYGSPPSLAPGQGGGSGWLTVRKYHLGVSW